MNKCDHNYVEITAVDSLDREWVCGKCGYVVVGELDQHEPTDDELQSAIDSLRVLEKSLESDMAQDD